MLPTEAGTSDLALTEVASALDVYWAVLSDAIGGLATICGRLDRKSRRLDAYSPDQYKLDVGIYTALVEVSECGQQPKPSLCRPLSRRPRQAQAMPQFVYVRFDRAADLRRCASAIRSRPSTDRGPVLMPPCHLHRVRPGSVVFLHGWASLLHRALHSTAARRCD